MPEGAPRKRTPMRRRLAAWGEHHARAGVSALGNIRRSLATSLMTAAVIGIALALPAAFLMLMDNVQNVTGQWDGGARASLFLDSGVDEARQREIGAEIRSRADVASVTVITPAEALAEFRGRSGLDEALALLDENPLPPVLVVQPRPGLAPAAIDTLVTAVSDRPEVARVRLDREWVQRLHALMNLAERTIGMVTALLGLTVVLVVGNTIRLDIQNRRDEIVITKLIGATDAFVRRPFLYSGLWYGLIGGLLACVLVTAGRLALAGPTAELARLYQSAFRLDGIGASGTFTLLATGTFLGLMGSWLAVGRHLRLIEPR